MAVGREPPLRVFVHDTCEVFNSHPCGSILHGWWAYRPASFRGLCTPFKGKFGRRPMACLIALFKIPSMVVRCLSLNTPKYVAWYLDFSSCSIANDLSEGLSFRFARVLASFLTSLVM